MDPAIGGNMAHITLTRVNPREDRWLRAVATDYEVPRNATVFAGWDHEGNGERIAIWVGGDGGGFGAIDRDPEGYVELSAAIDRGDMDFRSNHSGVDEWEFEPGEFDPGAETIDLKVRQSFF